MRLQLLILSALFLAFANQAGAGVATNLTITPPPANASPRASAEVYCSACHVFPEPDLLDKKTWRDYTLNSMKIRMGLAPEELEKHPESKRLKATGAFMQQPLLSPEEFQRISDYFISAAPETALPQEKHAGRHVGLPLFKASAAKGRNKPPSTTLVSISEKTGAILVGDDLSGSIGVLAGGGEMVTRITLSNTPVAFREVDDRAYLICIGSFLPSEVPHGAVYYMQMRDGAYSPPMPLIQGLPRLTDAQFADLNNDGTKDMVLSIFGSNSGRLSWFDPEDKYREHVIWDKPGALKTDIRDFNGDGKPDIAVLVAQSTEALMIFFNDGKGNFTSKTVFQMPPAAGHTYFEVADFNKDGKPDFLVTNGDNGEYPSPLKRYHGIRIYMNKGNNDYEMAWFYPMNGAFKAMARDFDQDGDLDIAAISFFPDYEKTPTESFVYFENRGGLDFAPQTFEACIAGRWLTMDAGDIDGDGDIDIVLGSYIRGPSPVPKFLSEPWEKTGPSVMILRNQLKK